MIEREQYWYSKWEEASEYSTFSYIYPDATICWDNSASTYDQGMGKSLQRVEVVINELINERFSEISLENALDIGSGTGNYTIPLSKIVKKVTAFDCSEMMNQCLREKLQYFKIENVDTITADFRKYSFTEKYDLVLGSMNPGLYHPAAFEKMLQLTKKVLIYVGIIPAESAASDRKTLEERLFHIKLTHGNSNDVRFPYELLKAKGFHPYIKEVECCWEYREKKESVMKDLIHLYKKLNPMEENWEKILEEYIEEISEDGFVTRKGNYQLGVLFCDICGK